MPYDFNLHDDHGVCRDLDGTVLPYIEAAHECGVTVANELMRNRERRAPLEARRLRCGGRDAVRDRFRPDRSYARPGGKR
jgi:uncharacterized protein DUF6894